MKNVIWKMENGNDYALEFLPARLTRGSRGVRLQPLIEPVEHGLVPKLAVLRLQNPVAFVGVVEQLRRHALALQGREELQPFADRHAVIHLAVNDKRRGLE